LTVDFVISSLLLCAIVLSLCCEGERSVGCGYGRFGLMATDNKSSSKVLRVFGQRTFDLPTKDSVR